MKAGGAKAQEPRNLPGEAGRFVGRSAELAALERLLSNERLVTILGPSGIGKTRTALRLAREDTSPGGAHFVDLANARTAEDLLGAVAQTLGIAATEAGEAERIARLGEAMAARGPTLLVFDNAEYAAEPTAAILGRWLEQAPGARFLVTSIVRLGLAPEACFEMPGLTLHEAAELYEDRARRVASDFTADRAAVELLVERLDRVPLAIELAAARARVLRPRQLLARLGDGFEVLRGAAARRTADRHASVLAAIRWSWDLLSPWEADALAQCSVFAGGFTLDAAEQVLDLAGHCEPEASERNESASRTKCERRSEARACGTDFFTRSAAPPVVDVLEALRDKSFLQLDHAEPPRFRLLESIRAFAQARLEAPGAAAARARHLRFYVELADRGYDNAPDTEHLRRLVAERENLRAAHRNAMEGDAAMAARASIAFAKLLALEGPPVSEAGTLEAGVRAARIAGEPSLLARLLRARAVATIRHGDLEAARLDLDESLALARTASDRRVELHVSVEIGRLLHAAGRFAEAHAQLSACVPAARDGDFAFLEGYACNLRGVVREAQGHLHESAADFEAARETFRRIGNRRFEALALMNLGVVQGNLGRLADAASLYEQARLAFAEIDDLAGVADAVLNLGSARLSAGLLDEAEVLLRQALHLEREVGNRRAEGMALACLGVTAHDRGELRTARELLQEGLMVWRSCGDKQMHGVFLPFFAAAEAALGQLHEARADFAAARAYFDELGDPACFHLLAVLEGFVPLAEGAPVEPVHARLAAARERLDATEIPARAAELVVAVRLLERAISDRSGRATPAAAAPADLHGAIAVGPEATFFQRPGLPPVDLRRRKAPRLLLRALVERRLSAPGVGLSLDELFEAGWPGDRTLATAAAARVYVAIRTLRTLGLEGVLLHQDDGYLLDPAVPLRRGT